MSRFFRTSSTPITDYGEQYPIEAIAMGLAGRQQSYNINKAEWEAKLQAIEDTPYLKLGLGDEQAHEELMNKYQKLIDESSSNPDFSQMGSQLEFIKREIKKDFGINGPASALTGRYNEYAKWSDEYKKGIQEGKYYEGDERRFIEGFNQFKGEKGMNSLGVDSLVARPDIDTKVTNYIDKILKDEKNVRIEKSEDGRYIIKTTEGGIREQRLNNGLNNYINTIPGYKEWMSWDNKSKFQSLQTPDGGVNVDSPYYQKAEEYLASRLLNLKSDNEKIDELLKGKKLSAEERENYMLNKEANIAEINDIAGYDEKTKQNIAANLINQSYTNEKIAPYMARANWSILDKDIKADDYVLADYKHSLALKEIDYQNRQALTNIIALPGQIVPFDEKSTKENFAKLQENYKTVSGDYNKATLDIFKQLTFVDKNLQSLYSDYQNATGADKIKLEREISNKVKNWYNDMNNGKDVGSYKTVLQNNRLNYDYINDAANKSIESLDKAENASRFQAQFVMTPELETSINDLKTWFKTNNAVLPPEIQKAVNSNDVSDFMVLLERGKISPEAVRKFSKLSIGHSKYDAEDFSKLLNNIDNSYKNALKNVASLQSQNTWDITFPEEVSTKVQSINEDLSYAVADGYGSLSSFNGNTVGANEKDNIGDAKIKSRKANLSSMVHNGKLYFKVTTEYEKEGKTQYFTDYAEVPDTELSNMQQELLSVATIPGPKGAVGRIAIGRMDVGDTFVEGDFLQSIKNGQTIFIGNNNEYKIVPVSTIDGQKILNLYYSKDQSTEKENREYYPVDNYHNTNPTDRSIPDINTVFEIIGNSYIQK